MWELSRGYSAEETQPTRSLASSSNVRSSGSLEEAVSWRDERRGVAKDKKVRRTFSFEDHMAFV